LRDLLARRGIASTSSALATLLASQASAAVPNGLASTITGASMLGAAIAVPSTGFLAFMSTTKMLVTIAALTCAATGFLLTESQENARLRAFCTAEQQKNEVLEHELSQTRNQAATAQEHLARTNEQIGALEKQVGLAVQERPAKPVANAADPTVLMLHNPEYQQLWLENRKTKLGLEYARLYKTLGLTPQQITDFENAQMESQKEGLDLWASIHDQTGRTEAYNDEAYYPQRRLLSNQLNNKLRQIFGEQGLAALKQYDKEMRFDRATSQLVTPYVYDLFYTQTPLTVSQADQLKTLIATTTIPAGKNVSIDWPKVVDQSQNFLTPKQVIFLKAEMGRQRLAQDLNQLKKKLANQSP